MSACRVRKEGPLDWVAECDEHVTLTWCYDWHSALEAAYGHVAMYHPSNVDTQRPKGDASYRATQ